MTPNDIAEAAERRKQHLATCLNMRHPQESPYTFIEVSTRAAGMVPEAEIRDLVTLADAYLSLTDPTPLTAEKLVEAGFTRNGNEYVHGVLSVSIVGDSQHWCTNPRTNNYAVIPNAVRPRTIGGLNMLLKLMEGRG